VLFSSWGGADETSLFQVILSSGEHLESLRLIGCPLQVHSVYFRQYPRSLPLLRDFGMHLQHGSRAVVDPDLFPAICDFLRNRPLLNLLELWIHNAREIDLTMFGFDVRVWEFLSSLGCLRTLSANLLLAIPYQTMVELIPRSVKTLTVPPCGTWHLDRLLQKGKWPDDLRFFGFSHHIERNSLSFAKKIATSIPSVRVMRLANEYFSVVDGEDGKPVRVQQWSKRASRVFRREYLESCGCEEHEYVDLDYDAILA